jgi:glycosyltransferase involved in cell wall biosynthesis
MIRKSGIRRAVLKLFWLTLPVKRCARVTVISEAMKTELLRYVSCDPARVVVIPVGISELFQPAPKLFNQEGPTILQVGTSENKNLPRLIEALTGINCTLHILGNTNSTHLTALRNRRVRFRYWNSLPLEDVVRLYRDADIVAFPSTYEGFGMPILEGQAIGRAVITSNVFSMPEVAGDGACLVDPFDVASIRQGVQRVISDEAYRRHIVSRGFVNVKRFQPQGIAFQYLDLYRGVALEANQSAAK